MINQRTLTYSILLLAIASFIPCLWLPITGEEGVYASGAYEALHHHQWFHPTIFGTPDWRPPFYQWLNLAAFYLQGQSNMLLSMRCVTLCATLLTTLGLMWLSLQLKADRTLAVFTAVCYLSGDVLFRRGWIAYSDPTFAALIFIAIACAWVSVEKNKSWLLIVANCALARGFLTKAITAYVFYYVFLFALALFHQNRKHLFSPISILSHFLGASVYFIWGLFFLPKHGSRLILDVTRQFAQFDFVAYLTKISIFPVQITLQLLPISIFALLVFYKHRALSRNDKIALTAIGINLLPYWFSTLHGASRYVLPIIPLMVLWCCHYIETHARNFYKTILICLAGLIVIKFAYIEIYLPQSIKKQHGDFAAIAEDVVKQVGNKTVIVTDSDYLGYALGSELDRLYYPNKVINHATPEKQNYFILETTLNPGRLVAEYHFGNHHFYLRAV